MDILITDKISFTNCFNGNENTTNSLKWAIKNNNSEDIHIKFQNSNIYHYIGCKIDNIPNGYNKTIYIQGYVDPNTGEKTKLIADGINFSYNTETNKILQSPKYIKITDDLDNGSRKIECYDKNNTYTCKRSNIGNNLKNLDKYYNQSAIILEKLYRNKYYNFFSRLMASSDSSVGEWINDRSEELLNLNDIEEIYPISMWDDHTLLYSKQDISNDGDTLKIKVEESDLIKVSKNTTDENDAKYILIFGINNTFFYKIQEFDKDTLTLKFKYEKKLDNNGQIIYSDPNDDPDIKEIKNRFSHTKLGNKIPYIISNNYITIYNKIFSNIHCCTESTFLDITLNKAKVNISDIDFIGNQYSTTISEDNSLLTFRKNNNDYTSDSVIIERCSFDNIFSKYCIRAIKSENSDNNKDTSTINIKNCKFTNIYHVCIRTEHLKMNISNNLFINTGIFNRNYPSCIDIVVGKGTICKFNTFKNFGRCGIKTGLRQYVENYEKLPTPLENDYLYNNTVFISDNKFVNSSNYIIPTATTGAIILNTINLTNYNENNDTNKKFFKWQLYPYHPHRIDNDKMFTIIENNIIKNINGVLNNNGILGQYGPVGVIIRYNDIRNIQNGYCFSITNAFTNKNLSSEEIFGISGILTYVYGNTFDGYLRFKGITNDDKLPVNENINLPPHGNWYKYTYSKSKEAEDLTDKNRNKRINKGFNDDMDKIINGQTEIQIYGEVEIYETH